jgi:hypothetical protein
LIFLTWLCTSAASCSSLELETLLAPCSISMGAIDAGLVMLCLFTSEPSSGQCHNIYTESRGRTWFACVGFYIS